MKKPCHSCPYFSLEHQKELLAEVNHKMEGILKLTEVICDNALKFKNKEGQTT